MTRSAYRRWVDTCKSLQEVRVSGVPVQTRFAQIMVEADYFMKRLANGSSKPRVPSFNSHTDFLFLELRKQWNRGRTPRMERHIMSRFWFAAGKTVVAGDGQGG